MSTLLWTIVPLLAFQSPSPPRPVLCRAAIAKADKIIMKSGLLPRCGDVTERFPGDMNDEECASALASVHETIGLSGALTRPMKISIIIESVAIDEYETLTLVGSSVVRKRSIDFYRLPGERKVLHELKHELRVAARSSRSGNHDDDHGGGRASETRTGRNDTRDNLLHEVNELNVKAKPRKAFAETLSIKCRFDDGLADVVDLQRLANAHRALVVIVVEGFNIRSGMEDADIPPAVGSLFGVIVDVPRRFLKPVPYPTTP